MKKAILITGIIWLIACLGIGVTEIIIGISGFMTISSSSGQAQIDPNPILGAANIIVGSLFIVGAVLDLVILIKRNSDMKKAPGIALGVIAAVFGASVPGILFAIDSGINRARE